MLNRVLSNNIKSIEKLEQLLEMLSQKEYDLSTQQQQLLKNKLRELFQLSFPGRLHDTTYIPHTYIRLNHSTLYTKASQILNFNIPDKLFHQLLYHGDAESARFLVQKIERFPEEKKRKFLTEFDTGYDGNPLMIVARRQPAEVQHIMNMINNMSEDERVKILKRTNRLGLNALMLAAVNQHTSAVQQIIEGIQKLDSEVEQAKIFQQQAITDGFNVLGIAYDKRNRQLINILLRGSSCLNCAHQSVLLYDVRNADAAFDVYYKILLGNIINLPESQLIKYLCTYPHLIPSVQSDIQYNARILLGIVRKKPDLYDNFPESLKMDSLRALSHFLQKDNNEQTKEEETALNAQVVLECVDKLIAEYRRSVESSWYGIYSFFHQAHLHASVKLTAAEKLRACIDNNQTPNEIEFTEDERDACDDGRLGQLWLYVSSLSENEQSPMVNAQNQAP